MSTFTTPLVVEVLDDYKYSVVEEFQYYTNSKTVYTIPVGFITDLASTPRVLWSISTTIARKTYRRD